MQGAPSPALYHRRSAGSQQGAGAVPSFVPAPLLPDGPNPAPPVLLWTHLPGQERAPELHCHQGDGNTCATTARVSLWGDIPVAGEGEQLRLG